MIPFLLLAAGQSSRMRGRDKLLEHVDGQPILHLLTKRALEISPTYVTIPHQGHTRQTILPDDAVSVETPDAASGMAHSLRAGIDALPDTTTGVIVMLSDMPNITTADLRIIKTHAEQSSALIVRAATQDGKPGHPIYFDRTLFPLFTSLRGDTGAAQICKAHIDQTEFIPLTGQRARLDLDTPEDWETYRQTINATEA